MVCFLERHSFVMIVGMHILNLIIIFVSVKLI